MRAFLYVVLGLLIILIAFAIVVWLMGAFFDFIWFLVTSLPTLIVIAIILAIVLYVTGRNNRR